MDFDNWKDALENSNTAENREFGKLTHSIKVSLKKLKVDLKDLSQTINIVEGNRLRFSDISDDELLKRRTFVNNTKAMAQEVTDTLRSDRTKRKIESDRNLQNSTTLSPMDRERRRQEDEFVGSRVQSAQLLQNRQDVVLDDMSAALARLGDVADTMNVELESQQDLLDEFDNELDETEDNFNMVMAKIEKLLGTSDRGKLCCIFWLFLTMCILFLAVVYT